MDPLLGCRETLTHQGVQSITRLTQESRKTGFLLSAEALENIIRHGPGVIGSTDSHAHPIEIECAQCAGNVFEAVVACVTPAELEPDGPVGKIEIIVDDDQLGWGDCVKREHRLNGSTRSVHETRKRR